MNADGTGDHVISRNVVVPTSSGNGAVLASTPVTASYGGGTVGSDNLAWAPDDHTIIFPGSATQLQPPANGGPVQVGVGSGIGLVRIEDDGTDALQLTSDQSLFAIHPSVTADGKYVVYQNYLSKYPLDHFSVMYASMDGSSNSLTTKPNGTEVPAPPGVVSIDTPSVAPNGRVYFNAEISNSLNSDDYEYDIWSSGLDGSSPLQITHANVGAQEQFWGPSVSPDGSKVSYVYTASGAPGPHILTTSPREIGVMNADGSNERILSTDSTLDRPAYPPPLPSSAQLAASFMPILDFDSGEKWRPLNADYFMGEQDPSTGQPWNQICASSGNCKGLSSGADLQSAPTSSGYIIIHNSGGNPDSYRSPNSSCIHNVGSTLVYDCDTGNPSAIYYHLVGPSPGGYTYIDYWFFYRYNQGYQDIGNHAGDWEGVTVAPSKDGNTFAFAEFSQHGSWNSFLRANLRCDNGGLGSCGTDYQTPSWYWGQHVMTFPAAGSHANYSQPGTSDSTDGSNDGKAPWGRNLDPSALIPFPPNAPQGTAWTSGPENWTDWPGMWGDTTPSGVTCTAGGIVNLLGFGNPCSNSPTSPAAPSPADHGPHFFAPWSGVSCDPGAACPAAVRRSQPLACSSWFGAGVAALACARSVMDSALLHRDLARAGGFTLRLLGQRRSAATAPGLAQAMGRPLRLGERAVLQGHAPAGTELLVRAIYRRRLEAFVFDGLGPFRGKATVTIIRGRHSTPQAVLTIGRARIRPSLSVGVTLPARSHRVP
jgi:hypothetical protein